MANLHDVGEAALREMAPELFPPDGGSMPATGFAPELAEQTMETVFGRLWVRPGLDRRSRSLVTVGMLIALRAEDELEVHLPIAMHNGVTREELEEIVYHSAAYAGFPAAATARRVGAEILDNGAEPRHASESHTVNGTDQREAGNR